MRIEGAVEISKLQELKKTGAREVNQGETRDVHPSAGAAATIGGCFVMVSRKGNRWYLSHSLPTPRELEAVARNVSDHSDHMLVIPPFLKNKSPEVKSRMIGEYLNAVKRGMGEKSMGNFDKRRMITEDDFPVWEIPQGEVGKKHDTNRTYHLNPDGTLTVYIPDKTRRRIIAKASITPKQFERVLIKKPV